MPYHATIIIGTSLAIPAVRTRRYAPDSKAEDAYHTSAPGPYFMFLIESGLLVYFCSFVRVILFISSSLLYVFSLSSHLSLEYILLIIARILVS